MENKRYRMVLPFSGFYGTMHGEEFDRDVQMIFEDDHGELLIDVDLYEKAAEDVDLQKAYEMYAADYVEEFAKEVRFHVGDGDNAWLSSMKLEQVHSPMWYNFSTDRIFVTISEADAQALYERTDKDALRAYVKEYMKPEDYIRKGYEDDIDEWGDFEDWDHNQMGMLLEACLLGTYQEDAQDLEGDVRAVRDMIEDDIMERLRGNGNIHHCVVEAGGEIFQKASKEALDCLRATENAAKLS